MNKEVIKANLNSFVEECLRDEAEPLCLIVRLKNGNTAVYSEYSPEQLNVLFSGLSKAGIASQQPIFTYTEIKD